MLETEKLIPKSSNYKSESAVEKPISILANKIKEVESISEVAARKSSVKNTDIRSKRKIYNYITRFYADYRIFVR